MATVSNKIFKHYNKNLLKPFILSNFQKSEKVGNKFVLTDFGDDAKEEKGKEEVVKDGALKEEEKSSQVDDIVEEHNDDKNGSDIVYSEQISDNKKDIDREFEMLENRLKSEASIEINDQKDKSIDENIVDSAVKTSVHKDENKNIEDEDVVIKENKNVEDEHNKENSVPMIEESRHLEILEAERNKYKKLGYKEGYDKALLEAKEKFLKEYEAKKDDYLEMLASSFSDAIGEIKKIRDVLLELDRNLPKIVLNLVRRIVGLERKINDKIIISVVKSKIEKLKALEDIKFYVNPEDMEYLKYEFPGYEIEGDTNIMKGSFRVKTRIGEVIFDLDRMLDDLEEIIYEELKVTESD